MGIRITTPASEAKLSFPGKSGVTQIGGKFVNAAGDDVFVLVKVGTKWWPQLNQLQVTGRDEWTTPVHFGILGPHTICIVRAFKAGLALAGYYRKVVRINEERLRQMKEKLKSAGKDEGDFFANLHGSYQSIEMNKLPKGLELQAEIEVNVEFT